MEKIVFVVVCAQIEWNEFIGVFSSQDAARNGIQKDAEHHDDLPLSWRGKDFADDAKVIENATSRRGDCYMIRKEIIQGD